MWAIKIILIATLFGIFVEDYKDRKVYWFFYPIVGIIAFFLHSIIVGWEVALSNSVVNIAFTTIILAIAFLYAATKLKRPFLKEVFGIGDVLFFLFISFSFSTISFLVLFVFSLLLSLLLHRLLNSVHTTVPLAGYMSSFFAVVYMAELILECDFLYAY